MNKKVIVSLIFIVVVALLLLLCCNKKIKTTDLSKIYLNNMTINADISNYDLSEYTKTDRYSGNYKYKFNEIIIGTTNKNIINYLFARFDEDYINILVNNKKVETTADLKETLGNNYQDKNYDSEQRLRKYIYKDVDNKIKAEFVYSTWDGKLVWITLSK